MELKILLGCCLLIAALIFLLWKCRKLHHTRAKIICELKREIFNLTNTDPTLEFKIGNCSPTKIEEE